MRWKRKNEMRTGVRKINKTEKQSERWMKREEDERKR